MCRCRQREGANEVAMLRHDGATNKLRWSQRLVLGLGMKAGSPAPQRGQGQVLCLDLHRWEAAPSPPRPFYLTSSIGDGWLLPHFSLLSHKQQTDGR